MPEENRVTRDSEYLPKTFKKIIVAVAVGALTYFVGASVVEGKTLDGMVAGIILAAFVGGVTFVVQFLMEVDGSLQRLRLAQDLHNARLSQATALFTLVEASALQTDVVTKFVRNATKVSEELPELVKRVAQYEIARMSRFLGDLPDGRVIYEGEDRDWLLGLAINAEISVHAISLASVDAPSMGYAGGFWTTDLGQRYVRLQRDLVQRNVEVRRIFILDRPDDQESDAFLRVVNWQREVGIEVRVLAPSDIPATLRGNLFDFIVFDNVLTYESMASHRVADGLAPMISSTALVLDRERVLERVERFRELWECSTPLH